MIKIEIETTENYHQKTSINWNTILDKILKQVIKNLYEYITTPGEGVINGSTPSGGAPVDTGELISNHQIQDNGGLEKSITNPTSYLNYVINGTSKQEPNNYPQRAIENLLKEEYENIILAELEKLKLK